MPTARYVLQTRYALRGVKEFISYLVRTKRAHIAFAPQIYRAALAVYRRKDQHMEEKTIKELAIELTVEVTKLCDVKSEVCIYKPITPFLFVDWSKRSRSKVRSQPGGLHKQA